MVRLPEVAGWLSTRKVPSVSTEPAAQSSKSTTSEAIPACAAKTAGSLNTEGTDWASVVDRIFAAFTIEQRAARQMPLAEGGGVVARRL
jgi:hypothetical protein